VEVSVSVRRLRLGIVLFLLWWLPIWLLAPFVARFSNNSVGHITVVIAIVQTVLGVLGLVMVGKQVAKLLRHTAMKKLPKVVWHLFWSGKADI
jgi:hypothetical protein